MKKNLLKTCGLAVLFCLFAFAGSLSAQTTVNKTVMFKVENGNGDHTWTVPTEMDGLPITVTNIRFEAIGGGGAGGYVYDHKGGEAASGGGGGGAYVYLEVANPQETSYTIHVGKGGTSTASQGGSTNVDGDFSSVTGSNGIILKAAGGKTVVPVKQNSNLSPYPNYYTFDGALGGQVADCIPQANASAGGKGGDGWFGTWFEALNTRGGAGAQAGGTSDLAGGRIDSVYHSALTSTGYAGENGRLYGGGGSGAQAYSIRVVGSNMERNGGAGADGVVRVTYSYEIDAAIAAENVETTICPGEFNIPLNISLTNIDPEDVDVVLVPASLVPGIQVLFDDVTYTNNQFVMPGNVINTNNQATTFVANGTAIYSNDLSEQFTVTITVYSDVQAGAIHFQDNSCAIVVEMAEATGGSGSYSYKWLMDNIEIADANGLTYTPTEYGQHEISGVAIDEECAIRDTTNPVSVGYSATSNPFDPGTIGRNDTTVCPNNTYNTTLYANTTVSGTIQWQRKYNENQWKNVVSHGPSHGTRSYNVLIHAAQFDTVNTASYRYLIKPTGCDEFVPCNDVFTVSKMQPTDFSDQFEDVTITLKYGACDTNVAEALEAPELGEDAEAVLAADQNLVLTPNEEPYKIIWEVYENECLLQYDTQLVTVEFPACGEDFYAEDAENNSYATVRIGCECWMAENLRSSGGYYFNEDASYSDFGRLYSMYYALNGYSPLSANGSETEEEGEDFVQGICPDGWALPTLAQYQQMVADAGGIENVKSDEAWTWLNEYVGNNESGFSAMAPGFYNYAADQYQKHLSYAGFWTSTPSEIAGRGVIFEINYNCSDGKSSNAMEYDEYSVRCVKVNVEDEEDGF